MSNRSLLAQIERLTRETARRQSSRFNYCPHSPEPKQREFLALDCLEALYGGAAGGGKSDALLMAALEYANVPGYAALILRRTFPDLLLPGAIMDRAKAWLLPQGVPWNDRDKQFTFPSGATITFGYCNSRNDRYRYQSSEFQFIGFDELTQWPEQWYTYLLSRIRRLQGATVPLRARAGTNPGGIGHEWVRRRFVDEKTRQGRAFVPALLSDNPHLDQETYLQSLAQLDETTRRQLQHGIWVRDASGLVYHYDEVRNAVLSRPATESWFYILALDFGVKDATAFAVLAWRPGDRKVYVVESWKERGTSPGDVGERVLAMKYDWCKIVGDVGGLGKGFAEEMRRRFHIPVEPAEKTNKLGYIRLFNGSMERGEVLVVRDTNSQLIAEWQELPWADETQQAEAEGFDNHISDGVLYGWRAANNFHEQPIRPKPELGTAAYYAAVQDELEQEAEEALQREQKERDYD